MDTVCIESNSTKEETTPKPERLCVSEFGRSCDENDNSKPIRYNMESDETSGEDSDYDYEESDEILPVDPPSSEESSEEDEDDKYKPYEEKNHTKQSTYYTVSSNILIHLSTTMWVNY